MSHRETLETQLEDARRDLQLAEDDLQAHLDNLVDAEQALENAITVIEGIETELEDQD